MPENMSLDKAVDFLSSLEENNSPELFGLHPNASFQASQFETSQLLANLVLTCSRSGVSAKDQAEAGKAIC